MLRNDPRGCVFRVPDNDLYFNDAEEGTGSRQRLPCHIELAPLQQAQRTLLDAWSVERAETTGGCTLIALLVHVPMSRLRNQ